MHPRVLFTEMMEYEELMTGWREKEPLLIESFPTLK
jgi:hypothetical protein